MIDINHPVASHAIHALIAAVLYQHGFQAANPQPIMELEHLILSHITALATNARQRASLANRLAFSPFDLLEACEDEGFSIEDLAKAARKGKRKGLVGITPAQAFEIIPPPPSPPSFLLSDSEEDRSAPTDPLKKKATKKRKLAQSNRPAYVFAHAPPFPPNHSYLSTPASAEEPKSKEPPSIPSMEAKLAQTRLVEGALARLIGKTSGREGKDRKRGVVGDGGERDLAGDLGLVNYWVGVGGRRKGL